MKHLDEIDFMRLLGQMQSRTNFFSKQAVDLSGDEKYEHLLECRYCLHDLWECYLSQQALLENEKQPATARLTINQLARGFNVETFLGFLFPTELNLLPALRAGDDESGLGSAGYHIFKAELPGILFKLKIKSTSVALELLWQVEQLTPKVTSIALYSTGEEEALIESQSLSGSKDQAIFMAEKDMRGTFTFKAEPGSIELLELNL